MVEHRFAIASRASLLLLAAVLMGGALIAIGAYRATPDGAGTSDFDDFWRTARHDVLAHRTITPRYGVHNYLPFFMVVMSPLGLLSVKAASVAFNTLSLAAFAFTMWVVRGWVSGRAVLLAMLLVAAYAADCILLGQTVLIVGVLLVLCWRLFERRWSLTAGGVLAVAASIKLFPIVLALFFLLKRRFRVVGGLALGLIVCNVALPALVFGPRESWSLHRDFWRRSIEGQSLLALTAADSDKMSFANQSLPVVLRRLLMPVDAGRHYNGRGFRVNVADWGGKRVRLAGVDLSAAQWLLIGVLGGLTLLAIVVARHPASRLPPNRLRSEYAAFILLSMLLSPVLWTFYFSLCFLPLALLLDRVNAYAAATRRSQLTSGGVLTLWALATPLLAWPEARAVGIHYWASVLLLLGLVGLMPRATAARRPPL